MELLVKYRTGAKPIRTQLCVCLAGLALQMLEWHDVLPVIRTALGDDIQGSVVFLEFLTILPEEVMDGRKISLSVGFGECGLENRETDGGVGRRACPSDRRIAYEERR